MLRPQTSHAVTPSFGATANEFPQSFVLPLLDDDDDLMMDSVSRVRLVQFQKDTDEPMGITLKVGFSSYGTIGFLYCILRSFFERTRILPMKKIIFTNCQILVFR